MFTIHLSKRSAISSAFSIKTGPIRKAVVLVRMAPSAAGHGARVARGARKSLSKKAGWCFSVNQSPRFANHARCGALLHRKSSDKPPFHLLWNSTLGRGVGEKKTVCERKRGEGRRVPRRCSQEYNERTGKGRSSLPW
jgi:hypothetical protein